MANLSKENISVDGSKKVFEKFFSKIRIITTNLFSSSSPMTTAEKIGLFFTIVSFAVILSPISLSDADPYYIKGIFNEVKNSIPLIEDLYKDQEIQHTLTIHLKYSQNSHLDATERVILGKYRSLTN